MRQWTPAQRNAIYASGGNLLVSAAAGSGKTAVLVERVIKMVTDEEKNIDIDNLLIVTFTNAAAAEMKSRISSSLRKIIKDDSSNLNAQRQLSLLPNAEICTIDSFCISLVREHFFEIGISNEFKILDDSESDQICERGINEVLDEFYAKNDVNFLRLAETFTLPDNDTELILLIKELLTFIYAQPFPYEWLKKAIDKYDSSRSFDESIWSDLISTEIRNRLDAALALNEALMEYVPQDDPIYEKYFALLQSDKLIIESVIQANEAGVDAVISAYPLKFDRFPIVRKAHEETKELIKTNRNCYKDILTKDISSFLVSEESDYIDDTKQLYPLYKTLFDIILRTDAAIRGIKDEKNAYSFSDIEHFAIELLFKLTPEEKTEKTTLAKELETRYKEILVDEYQDTNEAQDKLFEYLSNGENRFMVGDVKQSIYRFRLAMPQIFNEKRLGFDDYDENNPNFPAKIILDRNFRSRSTICAYVNHVFSLLMTKEIGEVDYNEREYLYPGADYEKTDVPSAQLMLLDGVTGEDKDSKEAAYIAKIIKNKINSHEQIKDGDSYREIRYGDIAIFMRSLKEHVVDYVDTLTQYGIPVICDNSSNLFDNSEIQLLLSLLRVIDNPMQDIPLIALMMSPIYAFTADEMAEIRVAHRSDSLYMAVLQFDSEKTRSFVDDIAALRKIAVTMSVSAFLRMVADEKNIFVYAHAMGNGEQRAANIIKFIELASRFDAGENVGMTAFMRYIDRIIESDRKTDSAPVVPTGNDAVKIMSIHHSKGLEFPVCILAGAGRKYNTKELSKKLLLHSEFGIAAKCHDENGYYQYPSLPYIAVKNAIRRSMMSENLRVLYVAMTRAKEQFITFAALRNLESTVKKLSTYLIAEKSIPYFCSKISDDVSFLIMTALTHPDGGKLRDLTQIEIPLKPSEFKMHIENIKDLDEIETSEKSICSEYSEENLARIEEKLSYSYPGMAFSGISAKRSASSLDDGVCDYDYFTSAMPAFMNEKGMTPAEKGTAMHSFMQFCDYYGAKNNLDDEIASLVNKGFLSHEQACVLNRNKLTMFFSGEFAKRMFDSKRIYREIKVSSFVKASEIEDVDCDSEIFVQGIADCVFEEAGGLVIVDYKTDKVSDENELLNRYKNQLAFYKNSISKTFLKPVKEVYLYSFALSKPCMYK